MAFGNEADDFMKSFTNVFSLASKFPNKDERRLQKAQATAAEQAITPEAQALKRQGAEAEIGYKAAQTRETTANAIKQEFLNSPELQDLTKQSIQSSIDSAGAAAGLNRAQTDEIRFKLSDPQVGLANAQTEAQTKEAIARAGLTQAQTLVALEGLKPENLDAARANIWADVASKTAGAAAISGKEQREATDYLFQMFPYYKSFKAANPDMPDNELLKKWNIPDAPLIPPKPDAEAPKLDTGATRSLSGAIPTAQDSASAAVTGKPIGGLINAQESDVMGPGPDDPDQGHDGGPASSVSAVPDGETAQTGGERIIQAQSGTRNQPISDKLHSVLDSVAADTGLTIRVTSGGQPSSGPNRKGSHRHDHGNAADLQLIDENGHVLSMKNSADRERMSKFVSLARKNGATGIGAGEDYMGDKTMHVGFGTPGYWGGGGHRKNAPEWLASAYNGVEGAADEVASAPRASNPEIVDKGREASVAAWKYLASAGGAQGAIPTQQDMGSTRSIMTGEGGMKPQEFSQAAQNYQATLPDGVQQTLAQRNLGMLTNTYNYYMAKGEPEKAQAAAGKVLSSYVQKFNQYSAIVKTLMQNGRMDEAVKVAVKAYAFIPNGYDIDIKPDGKGNYMLSVWDMKDPDNKITEQLLTPDEMYAQGMNMGPADFYRNLKRAAGQYVPSGEMEQLQGNLQAGTAPSALQGPTTDVGRATGQPRQAIPMPNYAAMDPKEAEQGRLQYEQGQGQVTAMNKATEQPGAYSVSDRQSVEEEVSKVFEAMANDPNLAQMGQALTDAFGTRLAGVASDVRRLNPSMPTQDILTSLGTMVTPAQKEDGGVDLNYRLSPRSDRTMQNTVKVAVQGGQDITMSPDTFKLVQSAAQQALRGIQKPYYEGQVKERQQLDRAAQRGREGAEAERIQRPGQLAQQIEDLRNRVAEIKATGQQMNTSGIEARIRYLEQQLQGTQQVGGAIPVTRH